MAERQYKGDLLIEVNRLMTAEEIRSKYNIPKDILDKILPRIPAVARDADGNDLYLESIVDRRLHRYFVKHNAAAAAMLRKDGPILPDRLRIGGKDYGPFTPSEMRLLEVLWGKASIVDEGKTLNHVYGDADPTARREYPEQALERLVKRLRRKLLDKGAPVEIYKKDPGYILEVFNTP